MTQSRSLTSLIAKLSEIVPLIQLSYRSSRTSFKGYQMADIDHRVRVLTDILMDRGFGWIAAEIIEEIERGRDNIDDRDANVFNQRSMLNQKLMRGEATSVSKPEVLKYSATRPDVTKERLSADDQVIVAVDLFVDRLSAAADMTAKSVDELNTFMNASVSMSIETEGETRIVHPIETRRIAAQLREIKAQLIQWLVSDKPPEED